MCRIKLICKKNSEIISDNQVRISGKEFEILDTPYYVVKSEEGNSVSFIFHYLDATEDKKEVQDDKFKLTFGISTGRLYTFIVKSNDHIANEFWESFKDNKMRMKIFNSTLAENNLRIGYNVVKKIYFQKFEIIE